MSQLIKELGIRCRVITITLFEQFIKGNKESRAVTIISSLKKLDLPYGNTT